MWVKFYLWWEYLQNGDGQGVEILNCLENGLEWDEEIDRIGKSKIDMLCSVLLINCTLVVLLFVPGKSIDYLCIV